MTLDNFVKKRKYLWWYVKDVTKLNEESIVEGVLNYGDWDDVQKLINILGIKKTADIFRDQIKKKRNNYSPKIANYFKLYFNKYAK